MDSKGFVGSGHEISDDTGGTLIGVVTSGIALFDRSRLTMPPVSPNVIVLLSRLGCEMHSG